MDPFYFMGIVISQSLVPLIPLLSSSMSFLFCLQVILESWVTVMLSPIRSLNTLPHWKKRCNTLTVYLSVSYLMFFRLWYVWHVGTDIVQL